MAVEFFEAWRQINGSCDLDAMVTVYEFVLVNLGVIDL
jgi:hypothetical protein